MEHPSKFDFFLRFKALINERGRFIDYVLIETSNNFHFATGMTSENILGSKLSDIVVDIDNQILGLKEYHYHMLPKTRRKFEHYIEGEERWCLVNLYSDERDYLMMVYTDITKWKEGLLQKNRASPKKLEGHLDNKEIG